MRRAGQGIIGKIRFGAGLAAISKAGNDYRDRYEQLTGNFSGLGDETHKPTSYNMFSLGLPNCDSKRSNVSGELSGITPPAR